MKLKNWRRDIDIDNTAMYQQLLEEDAVACDVGIYSLFNLEWPLNFTFTHRSLVALAPQVRNTCLWISPAISQHTPWTLAWKSCELKTLSSQLTMVRVDTLNSILAQHLFLCRFWRPAFEFSWVHTGSICSIGHLECQRKILCSRIHWWPCEFACLSTSLLYPWVSLWSSTGLLSFQTHPKNC